MRRVGRARDKPARPYLHPIRPHIPAVLVCGLCLWAGAAGGHAAIGAIGESDAAGFGGMPAAVALGAAAIAVFVLAVCSAVVLLRRGGLCAAASLGLALGLLCAAGAGALYEVRVDSIDRSHPSGEMEFECTEDAAAGTYGYRCEARIRTGAFAGATVRLQLQEESGDEPLRAGDRIRATATIAAPGEDAADYYRSRGIVGSCRIYAYDRIARNDPVAVVYALRNRAIDLVFDAAQSSPLAGDDDGNAGVLAALVCGYRGTLSGSELYTAYQIDGLAHLIAVSGAHLSIVAALLAEAARRLRMPKRAAVVLQAGFMAVYLVFAGLPLSGIRAAVMAGCSLFSFYSKRRSASLNALGLCLVFLIGLDPTVAVSVSFGLSAGSTLGIVLFAPLFSATAKRWFPHLPESVSESLALTAAASLCTTPVSAALFSQLPLIAPVSNCVAAPLFTAVCTGCVFLVFLALLVPPVSALLLNGGFALTGLLNAAVELLSRVPNACVPFDGSLQLCLAGTIAACVALYLLWPEVRLGQAVVALAPVAAAVVLCLVLFPASGERIVALDVGQGDAILIQSGGTTILVDTGTEDDLLKQALARNRVSCVDLLVITHPDDDHCGSLSALASVARIRGAAVANDLLASSDESCRTLADDLRACVGADALHGLVPGDVLTCGNFRLSVVWPDAYADEGGNADSLCLWAQYDADGDGSGDFSALFCGDAESDQLSTMISQHRIGAVDVFKVGHHGSKAALDEETAAALRPRIALVSVGEGNSYGHPAAQTLDLLEQAGASVFRTDVSGDVSCIFDARELRVSTQRASG